MDHPKITGGISFESYPSTKKLLSFIGDPKGEVEVEVNEGVATFKVPMKRNLVFRFFQYFKSLDTKTYVFLFKNLKLPLLS